MLERLLIKQFAIIDQLEIDFQTPFTVLTGETGAGKSILIDAVGILLGGRSAAEMIRHGAERAYIEGCFRFADGHPVYEQLTEGGWAEAGENEVILSRELNVSGKNPCRINGCTVSLSQYRQLAAGLLDIHGQHEFQQLMQGQKQMDILDAYGGSQLKETALETGEAYRQWRRLEDQLAAARENKQAFAAKKDFLEYQMQEIDAARLRPGEETELGFEVQKLSHSQKILKHLDKAYKILFSDENGAAVYDLLARALEQLRDLSRYDPELGGLYDRLEPASYLLDEAARDIDRYKDQMELSPLRLEEAENRLYFIKDLEKKYGLGTEGILNHRRKIAGELEEMAEFITKEEEWREGAALAQKSYLELAARLSALRREIKNLLEDKIDQELTDLAMKAAHFKVDLRPAPPGPKGTDAVEFHISTNTGEPFLPLAKIASGGELSRIALAMKRILAASDACETMIFDEIDAGVGGATIQTVADKLEAISLSQQVICVTHAPAIAAKAGQHFLLEKAETAGRTKTGIRSLTHNERIEELIRMLGGSASEDLKRHAQALLKSEELK